MSQDNTNIYRNSESRSARIVLTSFLISAAAMVAGGGMYYFVLEPRLEASAAANGGISSTASVVKFDTRFVNLVREPGLPASTFLFQVSLECSNEETVALVELHRDRFEDLIIKLHDSRTRDELDDVVMLKDSIQRQALQKANDLLKRVQNPPDPANRISGVFHGTFAVQDQM